MKREIADLIQREKMIYLIRRENDCLNKYICLLYIGDKIIIIIKKYYY